MHNFSHNLGTLPVSFSCVRDCCDFRISDFCKVCRRSQQLQFSSSPPYHRLSVVQHNGNRVFLVLLFLFSGISSDLCPFYEWKFHCCCCCSYTDCWFFFIYDWSDLLLLYVVLLHILLLLFVVFPPVLKTFVKFRGISLLSWSFSRFITLYVHVPGVKDLCVFCRRV